jgi:hypothetical protein
MNMDTVRTQGESNSKRGKRRAIDIQSRMLTRHKWQRYE